MRSILISQRDAKCPQITTKFLPPFLQNPTRKKHRDVSAYDETFVYNLSLRNNQNRNKLLSNLQYNSVTSLYTAAQHVTVVPKSWCTLYVLHKIFMKNGLQHEKNSNLVQMRVLRNSAKLSTLSGG